MKKLILCAFIATTVSLNAQDTIYLTNSSNPIIGRVTEVGEKRIMFVNKQTGVNMNMDKGEITSISYSDGHKEKYTSPTQITQTDNNQNDIVIPKKVIGKNIIAINCFEMFFTNFSISYERSLNSGRFSFKIPVSFGLGGRPNDRDYRDINGTEALFLTNKIFATGLEFNIYPLGLTRNTFYVGLSTEYGQFNYFTQEPYYTNYYYDYYSTPVAPTTKKYTANHYAGMIHIGGNLGLTTNLLIGAKFGAGYKRHETIFEDFTTAKVAMDLNLSYRF